MNWIEESESLTNKNNTKKQVIEIDELKDLTQESILDIIREWNSEVHLLSIKKLASIIANAYWIKVSYITWAKRNTTPKILRATSVFIYICIDKFWLSIKEIKDFHNFQVSDSTISRWKDRWKNEINTNELAKKLFDFIRYTGL